MLACYRILTVYFELYCRRTKTAEVIVDTLRYLPPFPPPPPECHISLTIKSTENAIVVDLTKHKMSWIIIILCNCDVIGCTIESF